MKALYASSILAAFMLACVPPSSGGGGNRNDDASNRPTQDADLSGTDGAIDGDGSMSGIGDAGPSAGDSGRPPPTVDGSVEVRDMAPPRPSMDRGLRADEGVVDDASVAVDQGAAVDCRPGDTRCGEGGVRARDVCDDTGQWRPDPCAEAEICDGGQCMAQPGPCTDGERICLPDGRPADCRGEEWTPRALCPRGQACSLGGCVPAACAQAAAEGSHMGCEFYAADLPNIAFVDLIGTTPDAPAAVVVVNPHGDSVNVSIHDADGELTRLVPAREIPVPDDVQLPADIFRAQTVTSHIRVGDRMVEDRIADAFVTIPPRGTAVLLLPRRLGPPAMSSIAPNAFLVRTNRPVSAYQYGPYCCNHSFSNDASALVPIHGLGARYVFTGTPLAILGVEPSSNTPPTIAIAATEDDTDIVVQLPPDARVAAGENGLRVIDGAMRTTLDAQEVLLVTGERQGAPGAGDGYDFSGAQIQASKRIAVFTVHLCATYPQELAACDALQDQLLPTQAWARRHALVPLVERGADAPGEVLYWKIGTDGGDRPTRVRFSADFNTLQNRPPAYPGVPDCADAFVEGELVLNPGAFCEFGTRRPVTITADRPVQVTGALVGQEAARVGLGQFGLHGGDPSLFVMPGERHYRRDYAFTMPETYAEGHITLISPPRNEIRLNGRFLDDLAERQIPGSELVYAHLDLEAGTYQLEAEQPIGLVVYGYDDFVSFAYPGGFQFPPQ